MLQMSDDNPFVIPEMDPTLRKQIQECNWQVVNVTTPANYFHVLRRQVSRICTFFSSETVLPAPVLDSSCVAFSISDTQGIP